MVNFLGFFHRLRTFVNLIICCLLLFSIQRMFSLEIKMQAKSLTLSQSLIAQQKQLVEVAKRTECGVHDFFKY